MDSKKSNKVIEIVKLQQILKKWKKVANTPKENGHINRSRSSINLSSGTGSGSNKSMKFLKKTLSFSDRNSSSSSNPSSSDMVAPKGYVVISVGAEEQRFIIKMEHLGHQAFEMLLSEAEDEYGFQQEGVLRLPCQVSVFQKILKIVEEKNSDPGSSLKFFNGVFDEGAQMGAYYSPGRDRDHDITHSSHQFQMCT